MSILRPVLQNIYISRKSLPQIYWLIYKKMPFYAVAKGRTVGIFTTWADCEAQVKGFSGARYKKFDTINNAQSFIDNISDTKTSSKLKPTNNTYDPPNTSANLKRPPTNNEKNIVTKKKKSKVDLESSDDFSDASMDSIDLNTILNKQLDDVEKRLKSFEKGIDNIIKKATKSEPRTILIDPPQPKKISNNKKFEIDNEGYVQVYTDGACSANGRASAKAGLGVYWGEGHTMNISEPVIGRATNNCGEIQAATKAIKQAFDNGVTKLSINTDSKFLINSVTKWMPAWKRKGWKLKSGEPVKNEKDFKDLDSVQHKLQIKWNYVEAHRGVHGNEMADQLAKAGASLYNK